MKTMMSGHCHREAAMRDNGDPANAAATHDMCHGIYPRQTGGYYRCPCPRHQGENRCRICRYDHRDDLDGFDVASHRCADNDACARRVRPESQVIKEQIAAARRKADTGRVGRDCECGCGGRTRGGRFQPGHDAKLKSILLRAVAGGDEAARVSLEQRGWLK